MTDLQAESLNTVEFEHRKLTLGSRVVDAAIADTPARWRQGMVGQVDVDFMLFVMPEASTYVFHMNHVERDLGIAVFGANGKVVDVGLMEAQTGFFRSKHPYKYALEFALNLNDMSIFGELAEGIETGG